MGRTGTQENKDSNAQMAAIQQEAWNATKQRTADYLKTLGDIEAQGPPTENAKYLQNENMAAATAAGAANQSVREDIENQVGRTGTNASAVPYYTAMAAKNRARAASDSLVTQRAQDALDAAQWRQWLVGAKLAPTGVDTTMFGNATSGRNNALTNLANLGIASYGPINAAISAAGQAAGAALGKPPSGQGSGGCWIAAAVFDGWEDPRTYLVRFWLNNVWKRKSRIGRVAMAAYLAVGESVARAVRRFALLRRGFRPLFDLALGKAVAHGLGVR